MVGERKTFKLHTLSSKCDAEKSLTIESFSFTLNFHVNAPTKEKEMLMVPKEKLMIDKFLEPYRGDNQ